VKRGGGTFLSDFDGGVPNRRYNSAGYAFRELNAGGGWHLDAQTIFRQLVAAGLLREKTAAPTRGDKVIYRHRGLVAHVAEIDRVRSDGTVIVRTADSESGVFEAKIDAAFFTSRGYDAAIYEWWPRPQLVEDPLVAGDPGYCNGRAPSGPAAGRTSTISDAPRSGTPGFCAGQSDCPVGGPACACEPGSAFCCPVGFCYMRDIAGCTQEVCPRGTEGRNYYDDTCTCVAPKLPTYDPHTPQLMATCHITE